MVEKIRDYYSGGTYIDGTLDKMNPTSNGRLGITGKFNVLVDEVGQITELITTNKTNLVSAINEVKTITNNALLKNSSLQTFIGDLNFGATTGLGRKITFNHDVEFYGNTLFLAAGTSVNFANTFIGLGSTTSPTVVGDGGLILNRGAGLPDTRLFYKESRSSWVIKTTSLQEYDILHKGNINANSLNYLLTNILNAQDINIVDTTPKLIFTKSDNGTNAKSWVFRNATSTDGFVISALLDNNTENNAYVINRTTGSITGHQFYVGTSIRLTVEDLNTTVNNTLKVNEIVEKDLNVGVNIDTLNVTNGVIKIKGTTFTGIQLTNNSVIINPNNISGTNFFIKDSGANIFSTDSLARTLSSHQNHYFDKNIFVDTILQKTNNAGVTFENNTNFKGTMTITSTSPTLTLNKTNSATDEKNWIIGGSTTSTFAIRAGNDLGNTSKLAYTILRTTTNSTNHSFYIGDNAEVIYTNLSYSFGNEQYNLPTTMNITSKLGFSSNLNIRSNNNTYGRLTFSTVTGLLGLEKYNASAVRTSYITLSDTDITLSGIVSTPNGIKTNTIAPVSGTMITMSSNLTLTNTLIVSTILENTLNAGVTIDGVILKDNNVYTENIISSNDILLDIDVEDNGDNRFRVRNGTNIALLDVSKAGSVMRSNLGGALLTLIDTEAINASDSSNILDFRYASSANGSTTRLGYVGFGSTNSDAMIVQNNTGAVVLRTGTNRVQMGNPSGGDPFFDVNVGVVTQRSNTGVDSGTILFEGTLRKFQYIFDSSLNRMTFSKFSSDASSVTNYIYVEDNQTLFGKALNVTGNIQTTTSIVTDSVIERTTNAGITLDSVKLKDGKIGLSGRRIFFTTDVDTLTNYIDFDGSTDYRFLIGNNVRGSTLVGGVGDFSSISTGVINASSDLILNFDVAENASTRQLLVRTNGYTAMALNENGVMSTSLNNGASQFIIQDVDAGSAATSNVYIDFRWTTSPGSSTSRLGVLGYFSSGDTFLTMLNSIGPIKFDATYSRFESAILVDSINEATSTNGVNVDGCLIKDGNAESAHKLSTSSGSAPYYAFRAYAVFDATRNSSGDESSANTARFIRRQGNIDSIVRLGVGQFRANFTTPMPTQHYAVSGSANQSDTENPNSACTVCPYLTTIDYFEFTTVNVNTERNNPPRVSIAVIC